MKSEYEIYMDFNNAMNQVSNLRKISGAVSDIGNNEIEGAIQSVQSNWTGENSDAYVAKSKTVKGKVVETGNDIGKVANTIEAIATRIRDAELEALRIAES